MPVFKTFFLIVRKHLGILLIYLLAFGAILFLNTNVSESDGNPTFTADSLDISIIDEDHTAASEALVSHLGTLHRLVPLENEKEVLLDNLYYRRVSYILFIPLGFQRSLEEGIQEDILSSMKIPGTFHDVYIKEQINNYLTSVSFYLAGDLSLANSLKQADLDFKNLEITDVVSYQELDNTESTSKTVFFYFQFLSYILIALMLTGLTPILIRFQDRELTNRIACSSFSLGKKNLFLSLGSIIYSLLLWIILIFLCLLVCGKTLFNTPGILCMGNSVVFLFVAFSLSLLLSMFHPSSSALYMISNVISLGLSFLCGVFVPQYLLGNGLLKVSRFLPSYWYIRINNMISGASKESFTMERYVTYLMVEVAFAMAIFALALVVSKLNQRRQKS